MVSMPRVRPNVPRYLRAAFARVRVDAAARGRCSAICFAAMADANNIHQTLAVYDSVNNAPLAYAKAP